MSHQFWPRFVLWPTVFGLISSPALPAFATDVVMSTPVTTTQTLDGNDSLSVTASGSISTTGNGAYGIYASGGANTITNSGTISTTGVGGWGIYATGGANRITNSGTISTTGDFGYGIYAVGGSNRITNSGTISTTSNGGDGISATGGTNTITNSGTISTTGNGGDGIYASGGANTITNSGTISTTGFNGGGIFVTGTANTITNSGTISITGNGDDGISAIEGTNTFTNSGTISTTRDFGYGISASGGANRITNSGTISTTGNDSYGISAIDGTNTITNSGKIVSAQSYAIYFFHSGHSGNTLNLNIPSFLGGGVYLGSGTTLNVVSGASNSVLWSTEGTLTGSPSLSGPVPIFFNASTRKIATFDPTGFAGASDVLADTTGNVSKLVHSRLDGLGNSWWMSGFGSGAKYDGSTATLKRDYRHSGMALGYDTKVSPDLTLGALIGYGRGNFTVDSRYARSFDNESNGEFVGIYGQQRWQDMFVNVALSAGFLKHTDARFVNDNSASLGVSGSRASYTSRWVSPQATVGMNVDLGDGWTTIPAAHLRYAWQSVKGYSETGGGDANAQVGGRTVQMAETRLELGVRKTLQLSSVGTLSLDGRVGGLSRSALGDNTVRLTMIDQSKQVATEMRDRRASFVGMALSLDLRNNVTFKLHGETVSGGGMKSFNRLAMLSAKF